ncbi:MAG: LemA family protein [Bacteroidales bacterium]|jgi:LemA protein|nr:LemA family protein [Bacteroidales bacterium]MCI1785403.1 LemA family protein [Bacteroidales bacterium]
MKKGWITVIIIVLVLLIFGGWMKNAYNRLVNGEEKVGAAWAQVENVYQRRADLIPNLVSTVKGYAEHESGTLEAVVEARAKASSVTVDPSNLSADDIAKFQKAQGQLSTALGKLMVTVERYPDLKANQNFLELQAQLEGSENRIATERMKFNNTAKEYNVLVRSFPSNIIAGLFHFNTKGYFQAEAGSETVPKVEF